MSYSPANIARLEGGVTRHWNHVNLPPTRLRRGREIKHGHCQQFPSLFMKNMPSRGRNKKAHYKGEEGRANSRKNFYQNHQDKYSNKLSFAMISFELDIFKIYLVWIRLIEIWSEYCIFWVLICELQIHKTTIFEKEWSFTWKWNWYFS